MISDDLAQIDTSARMPTTRPAPTVDGRNNRRAPQRSIQERSNSGSCFVDNRSRDEYLHVAYLNLRMEKFNPNREKNRHSNLQRSCDVNRDMELLNNFIVECGTTATAANFDVRVLGDIEKSPECLTVS
jgi:hypothetical protein